MSERGCRIGFGTLSFLALVSSVLILANANGYGIHRDELYYAWCGNHLALGYVDHSAGIALLARALIRLIPGAPLAALTLGTVTMLFTTAAALGGAVKGRNPALWIAVPGLYVAFAMFGTVALELTVAALATWAYAVVREEPGQPGSRVLPIASVLGLCAGLTKPQSMLFVIGLAVVLAARQPRWKAVPIATAAGSAIGFAPMLLWQSLHGWPLREFAAAIRDDAGSPLLYVALVARALIRLIPGAPLAALTLGTVTMLFTTAAALRGAVKGRNPVLWIAVPGLYVAFAMFGTVALELTVAALATWAYIVVREEPGQPGSRVLPIAFALGLLAGLTKPQSMLFVFGLAVVLAVRQPRWKAVPIATAAGSALGFAPMLLWQSQHGWPMREFAAAIRADAGSPLLYVALVPILLGPVPFVAMFNRTLRASAIPELWLLGLAIILFGVTGGKPYYVTPFALPFLAVVTPQFADIKRWGPVALPMAVVSIVLLLPVVPPNATLLMRHPMAKVAQERRTWSAWDAQVRLVHAPGETLLLANYGQASWAQASGLGPVWCGHNQFAFHHPPKLPERALAVGFSARYLRRTYANVEPVGVIRLPDAPNAEEDGLPIVRVSGPRADGVPVRDWDHFD
ncbi:MAG: hypothetical protein SFX74_07230 [Fimbriimonadaceae bacterium]|nr:hypothetical protein [Fimbriimonadaceae bacterium]